MKVWHLLRLFHVTEIVVQKNEDGRDERSCLLTNTDSSTKNPRNLRHFALDTDMKLIARNAVER